MAAEEGSKAPDFSLPTDTGSEISLGDYAGKALVLYFYPRADTSGCTKQAIAFTQMQEDFAKAGASILGVSPDKPAKLSKFRDKHVLGVALAGDESHEMMEAYGVWMEKSMYGRKYMGVERSTFVIDGDGVIRKVWRKVKVAGHAEEVLEAVRAL
ncbi:thioredoxin-dependent thiol peroxidase [Tepidamorphus sp. 3E244]|uniref:thioredoxin-dependent thiol peroxidase n=1 Tax=Tepidamorphus sp. 3E244 TaxID=3385498 RepID=UPI0038FCD58E